MKPQLHAPYFSFVSGITTWSRMARVLEHSARQYCPDWDIHVDQADPLTEFNELNRSANALKLAEWTKRVLMAPDGTRMLLMDSDMVINHPLDRVWDIEFDIAFAHRPDRTEKRVKIPINGGVVFLRTSPAVREFFTAWQAMSARMTRDAWLHKKWRMLYGGQNQAALGALLKSPELQRLNVRWLPCSEWDACEPEWADHWRSAKILHLKGPLRKALFDPGAINARLDHIVKHWHALEAALPT